MNRNFLDRLDVCVRNGSFSNNMRVLLRTAFGRNYAGCSNAGFNLSSGALRSDSFGCITASLLAIAKRAQQDLINLLVVAFSEGCLMAVSGFRLHFSLQR